jgi:outer membrane murein-binding lipoprotein Lpp
MLDSSARRPCAGLLAALVAAVLLAGCASEEKAAPEPAPTPIANLNAAAMQVPRIEFCKQVPRSAVSEALGGKAASSTSYRNGDEEELPGTDPAVGPEVITDVVHEIGCSWTTEDGARARAWVFARPVDAAFARTVIASGARTEGCHTVRGPTFGRPSSTQVCELDGGEQRVRHAGLFGQTWLSCELSTTSDSTDRTGPATGPDAGLRERTDRWCVEIVNALNTTR